MREFSYRTRQEDIDNLDGKAFDVLIIGGGIIGAGIANTLSEAGISVLLVDKGDFAGATSSGSSKMIHGGLRYLAQGRLRLTRHLLRERNYLESHVDFVKAKNFDILIGNGMWNRSAIIVGLFLYRLLGGGKHSRYTTNEGKYPGSIDGYYTFKDCVTDDARLTVYNVVSAHERGATCLNYVRFVGHEKKADGIHADLLDLVSRRTCNVRAGVMVNCAGSWARDVLEFRGDVRNRMKLSKGIHLIFPREIYPEDNAVVLKSHIDGRQLFLIPRGEVVIAGTTDAFTDDPDDFTVSPKERNYVLESIKFIAPETSENRILREYAGIRTLYGDSREPGRMSRDFRLVEGDHSVTVIGGKVTDYRRVSRKASAAVCRMLSRKVRLSRTPSIPYRRTQDDSLHEILTQECPTTPDDIICRRTGAFYFNADGGKTMRNHIGLLIGGKGIEVKDGFFQKPGK
ncbi:MAG: FAD-dependent oxidoreductase [Candidatus Thermoplasmatota archaeon]|jgi:glycerol-3-phosphate dehydrogenase|nr:FAD-dependent oxidoreductase [Candidatus Thermoplasmatota archaeon]MCL5794656.1 FAD-dependent oxidoreductase [Candidatus Thermoplasmatota archaeon]